MDPSSMSSKLRSVDHVFVGKLLLLPRILTTDVQGKGPTKGKLSAIYGLLETHWRSLSMCLSRFRFGHVRRFRPARPLPPLGRGGDAWDDLTSGTAGTRRGVFGRVGGLGMWREMDL